MYECMNVCMYECMNVWMYACMHGCMYVCVCVYVYVYVYVLGSTFDVFFWSRLKTQRAPKTKTHTII